MKTLAHARYRELAEPTIPAVRAERLAAELDRPDLVIRAGLARADMLHRRRHSEDKADRARGARVEAKIAAWRKETWPARKR